MHFPSNFSVCGVGLVRNSADELFAEGTCNVFGVDVCVVPECYGVVVLLWWSPVGQSVYSVPAGACASSVVPWFSYVFPPDLSLVCAHGGGDLSVQLRHAGMLWRVFASPVSVSYFVANVLW